VGAKANTRFVTVGREPPCGDIGLRIFEDIVAHKLLRNLFNENAIEPIESHPAFADSAEMTFPDAAKGVWRSFPVRAGKISERGDEDFFAWFDRMRALATDVARARWLSTSKVPDVYCGPDLSQFVYQVVLRLNDGAWVPTGRLGLVLVQDKLVKQVDLAKAEATVNPALLYHVKRTSAHPRVRKPSAARSRPSWPP